MKRLILIALAAFALSLASARPASAQAGFIRWLEKLSGPGPFVGGGLELYGLCYGGEKASVLDADASATGKSKWFWDSNCGRAARDRQRLTVGVQLSKMLGDNGLQYDESVPADRHDTVGASLFLGTADLGVTRALDIGAAVGFIHFTGAPPGAFTRPAIEPLRVTWKPLAMKPLAAGADSARQQYRREWLQLRIVIDVLPGGFDAEDFGAIPGTFKTGTEVQGNLYVIVNVANLLGW